MMMKTELKVGRERDALIAEKVMGCRVYRTQYVEGYLCDCPSGEHGGETSDIKPYFTSIAAAWEVVKELRKRGLQFRLIDHAFNLEAIFIDLSDTHNIKAYSSIGYEGDDAEAICLAALKAVGYEA